VTRQKNIKAARWQYFSLQRANKCTQFLRGNAQINQYLRTCDISVNSYHSTKGLTIHSDTDSHLQKQQVPNSAPPTEF